MSGYGMSGSKTIDLSQRDFTRRRSQSYQYLLCELPIEDSEEFLFTDKTLLTAEEQEQIRLLRDEIRARRLFLVSVYCNERQANVFFLLASGLVQHDVAKILNCNQTSIHKCLMGNTSYFDNNPGKKYGGMHKKLQKYAAKDFYLNYLFSEIERINNGK